MATTFFTTYRAPVNSFPAGQRDLGIHKAGRYSGFNILQSGGGLNIIISHTADVTKTTNNNIEAPNFGSLLFKTGIVAHVEDNINLTVETNSGNPTKRFDLIVAENIYQEVTGGTPITYSVVKGPVNNEILPALPNPNTQIIIGVLEINPNGFQYTDLKYKPDYPALPGDLTYEVLANIINASAQIPPASTTVEGTTRYSTNSEARAKNLGNAAITPANLENYQADTNFTGLVRRASNINITGGSTERNEGTLYITPQLLELFKTNYTTQIQQLINQSLPGQANIITPGIMRVANPQELAARTSMEVALTPGHLPDLAATNLKTGLVLLAKNNILTQGPGVTPDWGVLTYDNLKHLGLGTVKAVSGMVITTNPASGKGPTDWLYNSFSVLPPAGYTVNDLVMFCPHFYLGWLSTGETSNSLFLNWRIVPGVGQESGIIQGTAGTTSTTSHSTQYVKYTALYIKQ